MAQKTLYNQYLIHTDFAMRIIPKSVAKNTKILCYKIEKSSAQISAIFKTNEIDAKKEQQTRKSFPIILQETSKERIKMVFSNITARSQTKFFSPNFNKTLKRFHFVLTVAHSQDKIFSKIKQEKRNKVRFLDEAVPSNSRQTILVQLRNQFCTI